MSVLQNCSWYLDEVRIFHSKYIFNLTFELYFEFAIKVTTVFWTIFILVYIHIKNVECLVIMSDSGYDFQQGFNISIEYYNLSPAYYH